MYIYKNEAYTHALLFLTDCFSTYSNPLILKHIQNGINALKVALLNHQQDVNLIGRYLFRLSLFLTEEDMSKLKHIACAMQISEYSEVPQTRWENLFARRFESEIAVNLLKSPTAVMQGAIRRVSAAISNVIDANLEILQDPSQDKELCRKIRIPLDNFLLSLTNLQDCITLGAFEKKPTINTVKEILKDPDRHQLWQIMHIHYKFAQDAFRLVPNAPTNSGRGSPTHQRVDAANLDFYETRLFTACPNRGRRGDFQTAGNDVDHLGLMLLNQDWTGFRIGGVKWVPDCIGQAAELDETKPGFSIVRDMILNDVPYIAGFSGMCSLLMPQMMILCDDFNEELQRSYLCAVAAYIVGGGFHSIHEVLAPCEFLLKLIPGYLVQVPEPDPLKLAPPPNYKVFLDLVAEHDREFSAKIDVAWQNYIEFSRRHLSHIILDLDKKEGIVDQPEETLRKKFKP